MTGRKFQIGDGEAYMLALMGKPPKDHDGGWMCITLPWPLEQQCQLAFVCRDETGPDQAVCRIPTSLAYDMQRTVPNWSWDHEFERCCLRCLKYIAFGRS